MTQLAFGPNETPASFKTCSGALAGLKNDGSENAGEPNSPWFINVYLGKSIVYNMYNTYNMYNMYNTYNMYNMYNMYNTYNMYNMYNMYSE